MPPAEIFVTTVVYELEILANAYGCTIDLKIFEPNFVLRPLVVPSEIVVFGVRRLGAAFSCALSHRPTPSGLPAWGPRVRATAPLVVSQLKQSTFNLHHAAHAFNRSRRRLNRR